MRTFIVFAVLSGFLTGYAGHVDAAYPPATRDDVTRMLSEMSPALPPEARILKVSDAKKLLEALPIDDSKHRCLLHLYIARAQADAGNAEQALKSIDLALAIAEDAELRTDALMDKALIYHKDGSYESMLACFKQVVHTWSDEARDGERRIYALDSQLSLILMSMPSRQNTAQLRELLRPLWTGPLREKAPTTAARAAHFSADTSRRDCAVAEVAEIVEAMQNGLSRHLLDERSFRNGSSWATVLMWHASARGKREGVDIMLDLLEEAMIDPGIAPTPAIVRVYEEWRSRLIEHRRWDALCSAALDFGSRVNGEQIARWRREFPEEAISNADFWLRQRNKALLDAAEIAIMLNVHDLADEAIGMFRGNDPSTATDQELARVDRLEIRLKSFEGRLVFPDEADKYLFRMISSVSQSGPRFDADCPE